MGHAGPDLRSVGTLVETPRSRQARTRRIHPRIAIASPAPPPWIAAALAAVIVSEQFWQTSRPVTVSRRCFVGWPQSSHDPALNSIARIMARWRFKQAVRERDGEPFGDAGPSTFKG